jgi:hypothetical protein
MALLYRRKAEDSTGIQRVEGIRGEDLSKLFAYVLHFVGLTEFFVTESQHFERCAIIGKRVGGKHSMGFGAQSPDLLKMRDCPVVIFLEDKKHCHFEIGGPVDRVNADGSEIGIGGVVKVAAVPVCITQRVPSGEIVGIEEDGFFAFSGGVNIEVTGGIGLSAGEELIDDKGLEYEQGKQDEQ